MTGSHLVCGKRNFQVKFSLTEHLLCIAKYGKPVVFQGTIKVSIELH